MFRLSIGKCIKHYNCVGANTITRNVGFLRYWTISNIPLFLLATPMLLVLIASSVWAFRFMSAELAMTQPTDQTRDSGGELRATVIRTKRLLGSLALPQLLLAVLALTNYHVQIITRIASGSCIWYIWLAASIVSQARGSANRFLPSMLGNIEPLRVVAYLMVYAVVQAGLYSSFLPPA
jgi:phosphatidylinositol glycan class V